MYIIYLILFYLFIYQSLCNACGIKYRKQVEKMGAEVKAVGGSDHDEASTNSNSIITNLYDNWN